MSEISFEEMLAQSLKSIHTGDVVDGTVISINPNEAVLNIGYKSDGILTKLEYSNEEIDDLSKKLNVGDTLPVKILKVNDRDGIVLVSYKRFVAEKGNERLYEAYKNKEILKGKVIKTVKGGISVDTEGILVFIPASLVSDIFQRNLEKLIGEEIEFIITEFNPRKHRIIGDRRTLILEEKNKIREELVSKIKEGDVIKGKVRALAKYGAFVDIGGVDGLLHITEMSWGTVFSPKEVIKVGDELDVIIKKITDDRIALSLKFEEKNPWNHIKDYVKVGDIKKGRVVRLADFGAFVEIAPGVEGLLHVSQVTRSHVKNIKDVLSVGQEIDVRIIDFIEQDKKISLSSKVLEPEVEEKDTDVDTEEKVENSDISNTSNNEVIEDETIPTDITDIGEEVENLEENVSNSEEINKEEIENEEIDVDDTNETIDNNTEEEENL